MGNRCCRRVEIVAPALGDQIELFTVLIQISHDAVRRVVVGREREKWTARNADRSRVTYSIVEGRRVVRRLSLSPRPSTPFPFPGEEREREREENRKSLSLSLTDDRRNIPSDILSFFFFLRDR